MAETSKAGASRSNETHPAGSAYDVFVSFRGKDTRYGITDVLYQFMKDKGIRVFRDTEEIRHGEEIGDELSLAIPDSRIYVVVFSKDYASSAWCLREITMMVDCCGDKASGKLIFPIFYDVSPGDVKLRTDLYRSALDKHREKYKEEDVKKWEDALKNAGGISGMEYKPDTGWGTDKVLAIDLGSFWDGHSSFTGEEVEGMSNLRFLFLGGGIAQLIGDFSHFRTKLLWLRWDLWRSDPGFFKMDNLVILQISGDGVTDNSMDDLRMGKLRVLEISFASITRMPDLSHCSKLELINLQHCSKLKKLHSSIGKLRYLKFLNIKHCPYLTRLPEELGSAKALQELILMNCGRIQELPESIGGLGDLRILCGIETNIRKLPSSIGNLKSLEVLEIKIFQFALPSTEVPILARCNLSRLSSLRSLSLSGHNEIGELLGMEKLCGLQKLKLDVTGKPLLVSTQLGSLSRLEELYLRSEDISFVSQLPSSLRKLTLVDFPFVLSETWVDGLDNMGNLSYLTLIFFKDIKLSDFASLRRLCSLHLKQCGWIDFSGVERMDLLEELIVAFCDDFRGGIPDLSNLRRMKRMTFYSCKSLQSVPRAAGDCFLSVYDCGNLECFTGPYREYHN